jgi:hypothetical protein
MSAITYWDGDVRDVNSTCNILHVPRSSQFNTTEVLNQIFAAQQLLATGASLPEDVNKPYGLQGGTSWLGDPASDVMSCAWAKDLDGIFGTISVQLKHLKYLNSILPGDLLVVFMDEAGLYNPTSRETGTLVSIVIVDRVSVSRTVQGMATVEVVNITARDLAVVFSESATVMDQQFALFENAAFTDDYISKLFNGKKQIALSPMENILILLQILYDQSNTGSQLLNLQWKLSGTADDLSQLISLIDVATYVQNPMPFYAIAKPYAIIQAGNVWSLLQSYANTAVNEFFFDIRDGNAQERNFRVAQASFVNGPGSAATVTPTDVANQNTAVQTILKSKLFRPNTTTTDGGATVPYVPDGTSVPALVLRQRPYDEQAFSQLPVTLVDSTEIETMEFSRSSHDVFNWFRTRFPDLDVKFQEAIAGISIVPNSIAKFGFRRMDAETFYMFLDSGTSTKFAAGNTKTEFADVFTAYMKILKSWFKMNEYWFTLQTTMRFRPSIRIGTRLRLNVWGHKYDFYVQSVQHNFNKDPGSSRSQLVATRGRNVTTPSIPNVYTGTFQHDGFSIDPEDQ